MGKRGPAKRPTQLTILKGNPGRRPLDDDEPKPRPIAPKCPTWLTTGAKQEWAAIAGELEQLGLLTSVDGAALAHYCQAHARAIQAEQAIERHLQSQGKLTVTRVGDRGTENEVPLPEIAIAQKYTAQAKTFLVEFGLTPSSRSGLKATDPHKGKNAFEEYLNRGAENRKGSSRGVCK